MTPSLIDIILPVYNEEEGIAIFHEALSAVLKTLVSKYRFNVIYVLDRSGDDSLGALKEIAAHDPRVTILHLSRRFGHQMSLIAGLDHARGDASILMDCDMQHPPRLIPEMLERFEQGYDVVQAIRIYDADIHAGKKWTSHLFYKIQNWLSPIEIPVGAADFRLVSHKVRMVFQNSIREQNQFLRGLFQWVGFRQSTIDFVSPPRRAGVTKYRIYNLLAFSLTGITSFSKVPLRAAAVVGFVISALSVLYGLFAIAVYLTVGHLPRGYTSLIVAISFVGGLELTVLGILGEYLGAVFDEVKRRPLYIIDEVVGRQDFKQTETVSSNRFYQRARVGQAIEFQNPCIPSLRKAFSERTGIRRGVSRRFQLKFRGRNHTQEGSM
jgi:glycosyltransferase involved in cell wall biosynthesis